MLTVSPTPSRLDSLTGLRWWAAFAVFVFHMRVFAPVPFGEVTWLGSAGVAFFFVLSGFVLTWSWKPTVARTTFWWRRFARIWPLHILALLIAIPIFYSLNPDPQQWWVKPFDLGILLLSVVLIQGWWRESSVHFSGNPAAWTLTCEAFFYFLHPFLQRSFGRVGRRGAIAIAAAAIIIAFTFRLLIIVFPHWGLSAVPTPVVRLTEFVVGMGIAWAMRNGLRVRVSPRVWFPIAAALLVALALAPRFNESSVIALVATAFSNEFVIVIFAITIACAAQGDIERRRSMLRSRPLVALGDMSYAFYLIHATVMYFAASIVGIQPTQWINFVWWVAVLGVAVTLSAGLHYLVEKPIEKRMRSWWDQRRAQRRPIIETPNTGADAVRES